MYFTPLTASRLRNFFVLFFLVLLATLTFCQTTPGTQPAQPKPAPPTAPLTPSSLQVQGDKTLTLDPVCNACKGALLDLKLRNDSAQDVPLSFSHGPITSTPANKPFPAEVAIVPLNSGTPDATITSVKAHDSVTVRFTVTGVLGEAEWIVPVYNQGQSVVEIKIVNPKADFALKLDSALPENPELSFERGKATTLLLRNDADTGYSIVASYTVNGHTASLSSVQACENVPAKPGEPCIVKIPAHGSVLLKLAPLEDWFNLPASPASLWQFWTWLTHPFGWSTWGLSRIGALLKDQAAPGILRVQMASSMCARDLGAPVLSFRINTHLASFSKDGQSLGGTSVIAFVLLLGGTLSLILNFFLPMQARRRRLRSALQETGRKISDLSLELDSRVRVPVGVERQRLAQRIKDLSALNPQYGPEVTDIEQSLNRLTKRLDLLEQMQRSLAGYWRSRKHDLPATLVRQLENTRQQAVDLLQKTDPSDADLQKVLGFIQVIENQQNASAQANVAFAKQLIDELTHRKNERTAAPPSGPLVFKWDSVTGFPQGFFVGFNGLFLVLGEELDAAPQNLDQIPPENYALLDALRIRLTLLGRFQRALLIHPAPSAAFIHASQRLLADLQNSSWDSINRSDRLVREMEEGIFPEDIVGQVTEDHVRIKIDRIVIRQYEPAELSLDFANGMMRGAAARGEFTYRWTFDHDSLTEDGWAVSHYFPYATKHDDAKGLFSALKSKVKRWRSRLVKWVQTGDFSALADTVRLPYNVHATLITVYDGIEVPQPIPLRNGPLEVYPPLPVKGHALIAELFRLVLALGLAVLGLVAGAKDQILKLDVVPALIAVFLLGIGADQIKNLISQQADK